MRRRQHYSSLRRKWTRATAAFIFILFSLFSFLLYKSCVTMFMKEQEQGLLKFANQFTAELEQVSHPLSETTVKKIFASQQKQGYFRVQTILPDSLGIQVSDPTGQLLCTIGTGQPTFRQVSEQQITTETYKGLDSLVVRQPVHTQEDDKLMGYVSFTYELADYKRIRQHLLLIIGCFEVLLLLLSIVLGYLLATYFLRPLKTLTETMQAVKNEPQADIRMPEPQARDELSDIAAIFNEMLDRMQRYIEQQKQFVEDVSHELRTPVAIIEGHLQLLNRWGKNDPAVLDESLQASLQEIIRMKSLVQEMLDLSRAEQVEIHYSQARTKAKEVVYQTYNNFCLLYPEFVFTLDDDLAHEVELAIYRNHFEQILIILLDNAVKYSTTRKEVHISLSSTRNELEIAIQDFGEGINAMDLEKIFHRFYRVDKARSRDKGGNGLGLSIARQLLESYHGMITAESIIGYGSVFRITLPIVASLASSETATE